MTRDDRTVQQGKPLPERINDPLPELTPQERTDHWGHLEGVEGRNPSEFVEIQRDPDENGGISEPSKDEARVGLDLREQGHLPDDILLTEHRQILRQQGCSFRLASLQQRAG